MIWWWIYGIGLIVTIVIMSYLYFRDIKNRILTPIEILLVGILWPLFWLGVIGQEIESWIEDHKKQ